MMQKSLTEKNQKNTAFATVEELIKDFCCGKMIILTDDVDRENEGDLIIAAQFATPEVINFMATHGRGLICLSLTAQKADKLGLKLMNPNSSDPFQTAFTLSIEAKIGVTTGISAFDRSKTIQTAIAPTATAADIISPGHIFPLIAKDGGVLTRRGHTEAAVDLAILAGLIPAGVICEIMNDDGTMARLPNLIKFSLKHNLKIGTVADLAAYRKKKL